MTKKVLIIGGGAAGLSAASVLTAKGIEVELFESRPFLGGRMFSFKDKVMGDTVDNGQHLMTGFYYDTFKLLSLIGSSDHLARQTRLSIDFINKAGEYLRFSCPKLPSPLHFLWGLFAFSMFPKKDLLRFVLNKGKTTKKIAANYSATDFLSMMGQSEDSIEYFFRPLILATLNSVPEKISGDLFRSMLKEMISAPASDSVLAYSTVGLSDLLANPAMSYITSSGGKVHLSKKISKINLDGKKIKDICDAQGDHYSADAYIFALPPDDLAELIPDKIIGGLKNWKYSPIVSVDLWFDKPVADRMMTGFLGSRFHWCFDKASIIKERGDHPYITMLISAAYSEATMSKQELTDLAISEMHKYFKASRDARIIHTQVIKEKKATVLISPLSMSLRPKTRTILDNCFLAGDWIDTGFPATIESAVKSGFLASLEVQKL